MRTVQAVVERVRAEFTEMPGLHLTQEQVQRLCGIEKTMCTLVLDALVKESFPVPEIRRSLRPIV